MRCFVHHDLEAVGTCRACNKGLCRECASDLGHSISCRGACEEKAKFALGAAFVIYGSGGNSALNLGTVMGGGFIVFGSVLAVLSQRYARELNRRDPA
jgi:hypothetical protein